MSKPAGGTPAAVALAAAGVPFTPLPTVLDETAQLFDTIYVSAGRRGLQVELAPEHLVRLTGASWGDIAR